MKVGILSMQRVSNYGSWLQAYALKQLLINNGVADVCFIDIKKGKKLVSPETMVLRFKRIVLEVLKYGFMGRLRLRQHMKMQKDLFDKFYLQLDSDNGTSESCCDAVIIGSDEVFNVIQNSPWGYTTQLFGDVDCQYVFSYAGSFGHTTIEQLQAFGIEKEIGQKLALLKDISVRDNNSYEIIKSLIGVEPKLHLDPVLIYGYGQEIDTVENYSDNYVLIYSYEGRITKKDEVNSIIKFAKNNDLKIMSLYCNYPWCDGEFIPESPLDIFKYFSAAKFVITDTFHGSIFSIITHSNFCTIMRNTNMQKLASLFSMLGVSNRLIKSSSEISFALLSNIDYVEVENKLKKYRLESNNYLKNNISRIANEFK